MDLDHAHTPGGQAHIHYGGRDGEWGSINLDGTLHDAGNFRKLPSKRMKEGAPDWAGAMDTVTATFEYDPLFVISIFLDIDGMHDEAVKVDKIDGK